MTNAQSQCQSQCLTTPVAQGAPVFGFALPSILQTLSLMRSRRALAALTEEQLEDVGISASQAQTEAARPFWDAPASWKS